MRSLLKSSLVAGDILGESVIAFSRDVRNGSRELKAIERSREACKPRGLFLFGWRGASSGESGFGEARGDVIPTREKYKAP